MGDLNFDLQKKKYIERKKQLVIIHNSIQYKLNKVDNKKEDGI